MGEPPPREAGEDSGWPDAALESAYMAEAAARGETPQPVKAGVAFTEETETLPLPALEDLVRRIPPEVRETLDDLFRARFVRVTRVPGKALTR